MLRSARNFAAHLLRRPPAGWYPLLAIDYLTYACQERCRFCCDGHGRPFPELPREVLPAREARQVLARLRRSTDHVVITGGEPLLHPGIDEVLDGVASLRFDSVVLTTRAVDVKPLLPAFDTALSHLVVSIDTLDPAQASRLYRSERVLPRALANLEAAAGWPRRRFEVLVSAVATPENLEGLPALYRHCRDRGLGFALCPQLEGVTPHPALRANPAYRAAFDLLISEKRRGAKVSGSVAYLAAMRDLADFRCRPSTLVAVSPTGDVLYPCLEQGRSAGNILGTGDLHALRRQGRALFGGEPSCTGRCHSACALGFALALDRPWGAVTETASVLRAVLLSRRRRRAA